MARKKKKTIPGSVYASEGFLRIKFKDRKTKKYIVETLGHKDTPNGRTLAHELLETRWMESIGLKPKEQISSETPDTVKKAWDIYINTKHAEGLAPITISYYVYAYDTIFTRDAPLETDSFEKFVNLFLAKTKLSNVTVNNITRAIQIFISHCIKKKWLKETIDIASENKRKVRSVIDPFTDEEISKLIDYWNEFDQELSVFAEVMWLTGARLGDMLNMKTSDILEEKKTIIWYNKIDKEPEPVPAADRVFKILPRRADGRVWRWSPATKGRLNGYLKEALKELGIEARGRSWHEIRKNFCTKIGRMGLPVKDFLVLVRHKSLDTTIQKYLAPSDDIQHSAVAQLNAANNVRTKYVPKLKI